MKRKQLDSYVLITPARNEEDFIGETIRSVISQTVLPKRWVIVSDGSTDRTAAIVQSHAARLEWIQFLRRTRAEGRDFAAKVHAFNAGHEMLKGQDYGIIGCLDADLSFGTDYFEYLLDQFARIPSWESREPHSSRTRVCTTITGMPTSNTSPAAARCFAGGVSKTSGGTSPSRGEGSTGSPSRRRA